MQRKIFGSITAAVLCMLLFAGCAGMPGKGADRAVISHQQQIDRLEEELRNRDRTIDNAFRELGAVTSRSSMVEGTVDELIELFGEYQRRVEQLLRDYNKVRAADKDQEQGPDMADYYTSDNDGR